MKTKSEKIMDNFVTESKFLWNSSDLDETLVHCGVEALEKFHETMKERIDFKSCPEKLARKMGYKLILKTVSMIVSLYEDEYNF